MKQRAVFLAVLALALPVSAQAPPGGALADLANAKEGRIVHLASTDPSGGNGDMRGVLPGQTYTLADYSGSPGAIRRWWITLAPRNNVQIQRQCILRCYWDGETEPSVECPISDFFGLGFGEWKDFQSAPLNMTSGGYNCYWPMPFRKSCRITLENRSKVHLDALYYNIDILTQKKASPESLYFHAQFRRTRTEHGKPVTLLEATGRGHYVGTVLSMQFVGRRGLGFLEGDEQVTIDAEMTPSILGTGTEDYFSSGWYFDTGAYSALYHGCPIKDDAKGRISAYRWHILDPIPFTQSIRFDIEHGGKNDAAPADYCSVAFWYQTHPHAKFPPLPTELLPLEPQPLPKVAGIIEGESLLKGAKATEGPLEAQDMSPWDSDWSGLAQLWWRPTKVGAKLTLTIDAAEAGEKELVGYFTKALDYGNFIVRVNGQNAGKTINLYDLNVIPMGPISLGKVSITAGKNEIELEIVGKDARSKGYFVGLDGFVLKTTP